MESRIPHPDAPLTPDPHGYPGHSPFRDAASEPIPVSAAAEHPARSRQVSGDPVSQTPLIHDLLPQDWNLPGQKTFRRKQIAEWIFKQKVDSFDKMLNLPESLRTELSTRYSLNPLTLIRQQGSRDTTRKFLFRTRDQDFIECVLIPASPSLYGDRSDRFTL
ncbi:MAG: hypothetical protein AAF649_05300, partial [Verrucomicrobiota bacterium]